MPFLIAYPSGSQAGPFNARIQQTTGNRWFFDFGAALNFSAAPVSPSVALTAPTTASGGLPGMLEYYLASTPIATWADGEYVVWIDNGTNAVSALSLQMVGGDSVPNRLANKGLDSVFGAGGFNVRQILEITAAGAAGLTSNNGVYFYHLGDPVTATAAIICTLTNSDRTAIAYYAKP